jgi:hypothetical protein
MELKIKTISREKAVLLTIKKESAITTMAEGEEGGEKAVGE